MANAIIITTQIAEKYCSWIFLILKLNWQIRKISNAWLRSLGEIYCLVMMWIKPSIGELQIHVAVSLHDTTGSEESGKCFSGWSDEHKAKQCTVGKFSANAVVKWTYGYRYLKQTNKTTNNLV